MSGYFDIQVNGYGGVDFNLDDLPAMQLTSACERLAAAGVEGFLATIITEKLDLMVSRLKRLVQLRNEIPLARRLIAGIHIEGPFINEQAGYRGAHPVDSIHPADESEMHRLLEAGDGLVRLVTLAPERDAGLKVTRLLAKQKVTVSAGHCDPSIDELRAATDAGLTLFTHLGNGCPMQMHRHDNIIQRALNLAARGQITACFIADGTHVPFPTLQNYLQLAGMERSIIVTDGVAPAGMGPGRYILGRWDLLIGDDMVARAPDGSHFVGSAITMPQTAANLKKHLQLTDEQVRKLTHDNPRRAVGL